MHRTYRDILKHSSIYGIGQIIARLASFCLLPLYTSCLSPEDYGCIAVLDLISAVLGVLIGGGMAAAVNRHQFDATNDRGRAEVWWTGMAFVATMSTLIVAPMWFWRESLSQVVLGPRIPNGPELFALELPTLWLAAFSQLPDTFLRTRKQSGLSVAMSLGHLLLNIALNVFFLVGMGWGVVGLLCGNLAAKLVLSTSLTTFFVRSLGAPSVRIGLLFEMLRFSMPIAAIALLSMVMHQADRYFLARYCDMNEVGIYSLAYQIGQGVLAFGLLSFTSIWNIVVYEISAQPNAKEMYRKIFQWYSDVLLLLTLGAGLFARQLLELMADPAYSGAADLIPIVAFGYVLFGFHEHFKTPAMLAKKTANMLPASIAAAAANIGLNFLLVPSFGAKGAAVATVITFGIFSFFGLWCYRRIDAIPYPLQRIVGVTVGMFLTMIVHRQIALSSSSPVVTFLSASTLWLGWVAALFGPVLLSAIRSTELQTLLQKHFSITSHAPPAAG